MRPRTGHTRDRAIKAGAILTLAVAAATLPSVAEAASAPLAGLPLISAVIAAGAVALALATSLWALAERSAAARFRRSLRSAEARLRVGTGARDALLSAGREALVVWGGDGIAAKSYGGAAALIDACLRGAEALEVSQALDALADGGTAFALVAHDETGREIAMRGRAVGGMAAVWLEEIAQADAGTLNFKALLNALPIPVWLRDRTLSLIWGNDAFVERSGVATLDAALAAQASLERSERDLAATARAEDHAIEAKRFAIVDGQRRALAFSHVPADVGIVGAAIDVTDLVAAESRLQQHLDAHADTLNQLATAVAIFDRDQVLNFYNSAFARLWDVPEDWLDTHPTDGEILDRLRELGKLQEQPNYQAWRRARLALYDKPAEYLEEDLWHLPGGKTLRVVAQPHPFGGLTFLYDDVTEKLTLESSFRTLIQVQTATIDTLQEGVAVFGPDGRLKLSNAAFARIWQFESSELEDEPRIQELAQAAAARFGSESVWQRLVAEISSDSEHRIDFGPVERSDGSVVESSLAPLPDGATLATFSDVTDSFRFESALQDRANALEAADRLKSEFAFQASFLFRDPLNAVLGFGEMLAQGHAGALNEKQARYVQDILTASNELTEITSDLLDLAMIESGVMQLELTRVDLFELLSRFVARLRKSSESRSIELHLDCAPDVGQAMLDERRVRQIVFSLLSNALDVTDRDGSVTLGGAIIGQDVQIWVADTGPGIAPEMKARMFEGFFARSRAGQRAGAGLGLALVRRLVELHNGWLAIDSAPGKGTVVRCHLPRRLEPATPLEQPKTA
jgi:signal transduction histidine kinase